MPRTKNPELRERAILCLQMNGLTNRQIGEVMNISASTVSNYARRFFHKKWFYNESAT